MSQNSPRQVGNSYIPTLDGWRAVAITAVLFCHGLDERAHPLSLPLGTAGVLLFFAISGFLITCRMLDEKALTGRVSLPKFYLRRAFRILPPAIVFLATITFLGLIGAIPYSTSEVMKSLLFIRNYARIDFANPAAWYSAHFWSLSVEEHFYLLWPAILVFAALVPVAGSRRWRPWVVPVIAPGLALATILWRSVDESHDFVSNWFHAPYLRHLWGRSDYLADVLLWGCALAVFVGPRPWRTPLPRGITSLACALILAFLSLFFFTNGSSHGRDLAYLAMALLVGCTVKDPGSFVGRFLETAPLRYVGRLSYSLYLWQQLFFHAGASPLWFQRFPLNIVFIFGAACGSFYLVERPLIRLGRRFDRPAILERVDGLELAKPLAVEV